MKTDAAIIAEQLDFFRKEKTGCVFAKIAAKNPIDHGWHHFCVGAQKNEIENIIKTAIAAKGISTCSLIFPEVKSVAGLVLMLNELCSCQHIYLEHHTLFKRCHCFGFRVRISEFLISWVTGFGSYRFFPKTRRSPYVEITFRTKPRPNYKTLIKEMPPNIVHLADMKINLTKKKTFQKYWGQSFINTKKILGHKPDLRSAAKTTFSIPKNILDKFLSK